MENFYHKSLQSLSFIFLLFLNLSLSGSSKFNPEPCINANLSKEQLADSAMPDCVTAPVLVCPSIYFGCPNDSTHPNTTGWAIASPGDVNCIQPDLEYADYIVQNDSCMIQINRQWIATYSDNTNPWLYSECTQIIILRDINKPQIIACPDDIVVNMGSNCQAEAWWNPPVAIDDCGISSFTSNYQPGDFFLPGINLVVYTATDNCGNNQHCTFKVTVVGNCCDDKTPEIVCPSPYNGCMQDNLDPSQTGVATATMNGNNCPDPIISYQDILISLGSCTGSKTIHRNWYATNPNNSNLVDSCVQIITLNDLIDPTIQVCPSDTTIVVAYNVDSIVVNWTPPVSNDNCGIISFGSNHLPGELFGLGTTTVNYVAIDQCLNETHCNFNITVERVICNSNPTIQCPSNFVGCPGTDISPANTGSATAQASNPLCAPPIIKYKDHILIDGPCPGRKFIRRYWTAHDPFDTTLSVTCEQHINLRDNLSPEIQNCPNDTSIVSLTNDSLTVSWIEPTASDNCLLDTFYSNYPNGSKFPIGITEVIYIAKDVCGNVDSCTFNITIEPRLCEELPIITCPKNVYGCLHGDYSPDVTGYATAVGGSPYCDPPIITYEDFFKRIGPCDGRVLIDRTWIATDPNDSTLVSTCLQKIRYRDYIPPEILNCPDDITVSIQEINGCTSPVSWTEPDAIDNCGVFRFTSNYSPGDTFPEGVTLVEYIAIDSCGRADTCSFNITVECTACAIAPIIDCPSDYYGCPSDDISPLAIGFAIAEPGLLGCDMPLLSFIDDTITAGPCVGELEIDRIWTASDPNNWKIFSSCVQLIILSDESAPTLTTCPADITVVSNNLNCTAVASWTAPLANDNCGIASFTSNYSSGDYFPLGSTTVNYTVVDGCGLTTSCSFEVTVECNNCTSAPTIICPPDGSACPGSDYGPNIFGTASASPSGPNCNTPVISFEDLVISSGPCTTSKVIERTWKASDPDNNQLFSSCVQTISLVDYTAPEILNCPTDITVWANGVACSKIVSWQEPSLWDNCYGGTLSSNYQSGSLFDEGNTLVVYTATDACGNTATCSFNVIVECNNICTTAPIIYCPGSSTVCIGEDYSPSSTGYPTAVSTDLNCPAPHVSFEDILMNSGPCVGQKQIKRIWTAYYPNYPGIESSCEQWISVSDTEVPVFWDCPSDISVPSTNYSVNWIPPVLTDDCSSTYVTSTHNPGDYFPPGTTTVYYFGHDACGNTTTCSFNVTVGQTGNLLSCPDNIVMDCDGNGGAYVNWPFPQYTGNCGNCINGDYIPGFVYMGEYNGHHYYCSTSVATWPVANSICQASGGYLASINSQEENDFLSNILTLQSAFIGLHDSNMEGVYQWSNGASLNYTNWYPGQPNNYDDNQDYVEMLNNGQWNDQYNYKALEYIMEIPCNSLNQIGGPIRGSYLQAGEYTVEYELLDMCGILSSCQFDITIEGSIHMTCPIDTVVQNNTGSSGIVVDWETPTATSCCGLNCSAGNQISGFVYMGQYNGNHYYSSLGAATWQAAEDVCVSLGGHLACVESAGENAFLASQLLTQRAFIGLHDSNIEGHYEWVTGEPVNYTNWYPNQPNNYANNQHYIEMLSNGEWNDTYPDFEAEYILELPGCLNIVQIGGPASGSVFTNNTTTTITYQATDGCGNVSTCSFDVITESPTCMSGGKKSDIAYIQEVTLGSNTIQSGNNNGYVNLTQLSDCFYVAANQITPLKLSPGFYGTVKNVFWKVWIDFNIDGDFDDSGEYIAYGSGTSGLSGMITIPNNISTGITTMRVAMKCGSYPTGPCEVFEYGETEDHCIKLQGGTFKDENNDSGNINRSIETNEVLLKEFIASTHVKIYPNPAFSNVNIELDNIEAVRAIYLSNSYGQRIFDLEITENQEIDVSKLDPGFYFVNILQPDGTITAKKLIVI